MKKITQFISAALLMAVICSNIQCKKEKEEDRGSDCKTCRAYDINGTITKEVCSDAAETAFRSQYSGREISCQ